jgi:hypothetical protein
MSTQKIHAVEVIEDDPFNPKITRLSDARRHQLFLQMYEKLGINPKTIEPSPGLMKYLATLPARE